MNLEIGFPVVASTRTVTAAGAAAAVTLRAARLATAAATSARFPIGLSFPGGHPTLRRWAA